MQKPDVPIRSAPWLDIDLADRVARSLEHSHLHVFDAYVLTAMPPELGDPDDPHASLFVQLTLITDGERGWLVLCPHDDEYDVEAHFGPFADEMAALAGGDIRCATRAVSWTGTDGPALDLRDARTRCARLEEEYELRFAGAPSTDVERFLAPFHPHGYAVSDERAIRERMNEAAQAA